jgi:hypothetical protein
MPKGVFRRVFHVGGYALKVPRLRYFVFGLTCNRWEREIWKEWRPVFGWTNLCPVLFSDPIGLLVVMPWAKQPVSCDEIRSLPDHYPSPFEEYKPEDFGWLSGEVVALDYGRPSADMVRTQREYLASRAKAAS